MTAKNEDKVTIDEEACIGCGLCVRSCIASCIAVDESSGKAKIVSDGCFGCGHCFASCPQSAIKMRGVKPEEVRQFDPSKPLLDFETLVGHIQTRRSIRHYQQRPIPRELIEKLISASRHAPTARNMEKVVYLVISDQKVLDQIRECAVELFKLDARYSRLVQKGDFILRSAPALILAHSPWGAADTGIALETIELIAPTLGLGSCWAGLVMHAAEKSPALKQLIEHLGLPGPVQGGLMIGFPDEVYLRAPPRKMPQIVWA